MKVGDIVEVHSRVEVAGFTRIGHGILLNKVSSKPDSTQWHVLVSEGNILTWNEEFLVVANDKRYLIDETR